MIATRLRERPARIDCKTLVLMAAKDLRPMKVRELIAWAKGQGIDDPLNFYNFKEALKTHAGIDFDARREAERNEASGAIRAKAFHTLVLYAAASGEQDRFAICSDAGEQVWRGKFFAEERDYEPGNQASAEMATIRKAAWLASKVREAHGLEAVRLVLRMTIVKKAALSATHSGLRLGVLVDVEPIQASDNPASCQLVERGYTRWQDTDLKELLSSGEAA